MDNIELKNKYASRDVCDYELYDSNNNFVAKINSVKTDEFQVTKRGRYFLRFDDALIDKIFLDYITRNPKFEGYIKAQTSCKDAESCENHEVYIDIPKAKLLNYKIKKSCVESSKVNFLFELFIDDTKGYAIDFKI